MGIEEVHEVGNGEGGKNSGIAEVSTSSAPAFVFLREGWWWLPFRLRRFAMYVFCCPGRVWPGFLLAKLTYPS
jgi:hypothetical protein